MRWETVAPGGRGTSRGLALSEARLRHDRWLDLHARGAAPEQAPRDAFRTAVAELDRGCGGPWCGGADG
ncbi:MAG: hypothetical protein WDN49_12155 [Acetobacteraceae bacterium]